MLGKKALFSRQRDPNLSSPRAATADEPAALPMPPPLRQPQPPPQPPPQPATEALAGVARVAATAGAAPTGDAAGNLKAQLASIAAKLKIDFPPPKDDVAYCSGQKCARPSPVACDSAQALRGDRPPRAHLFYARSTECGG